MLNMFRKKTPEEKLNILKCKIAAMEKELEVLWAMENRGGYMFGNREEILVVEKRLAYKRKEAELIEGTE